MPKAKILIVEDDRDITEMVEFNLAEEGYETISAPDGRAGLDRARKSKPDVIILDIMLPVIDGFEVCKTLRADPLTAEIPIIILSAKSSGFLDQHGSEVGIDAPVAFLVGVGKRTSRDPSTNPGMIDSGMQCSKASLDFA